IALGLARVRERPREEPKVVEVDVRRVPPPEPPQLTPPEPPKPPPPEPSRKGGRKQKAIVTPPPPAPPPNADPPPQKNDPPKEPPNPVFGVTMDSTTTGDSSFSVAVGNTTMIDPSKSGKHDGKAPVPLPAAPPGPPKPEYKPVSELAIKTMPDIDTESCG